MSYPLYDGGLAKDNLSVLDVFAAMAMQEIIREHFQRWSAPIDANPGAMAQTAFVIATEMMAERDIYGYS
jgi:hypothetical protein